MDFDTIMAVISLAIGTVSYAVYYCFSMYTHITPEGRLV